MNRISGRVVMFQTVTIFYLCGMILLLLHEMENGGMDSNVESFAYIIVGVVAFLITAVSFIVMIINDIRFHRQDTHRFDDLDKESERLEARHDKSSQEHDRLSSEHDKLERNLSEKLRDMGMRQDVLKDKVFEYISKEDGRRENLAAILPQQDVISQIQLLYDKILALSDENTKLKYQNRQLHNKLIHMQEAVSEKDHEYEIDDMDIFEDSPDDDWEQEI